jgi:Ca2+/Na+ antiporter
MVENVCVVVIWPLAKILPVKRYPEIAVVLIFIIIYFMVEFIVTVMNVFSAYTGMSHFMVGLTLMVWGSDNMEMLNLAIAIGKGEEEMAMIAVLSC